MYYENYTHRVPKTVFYSKTTIKSVKCRLPYPLDINSSILINERLDHRKSIGNHSINGFVLHKSMPRSA